ncbi:MAG: glycosyl transferase family protein [Acidobacteria bacterium]|nr:glycosyl transferase family protein [Acidobacteriota bacterium]
MSTWLDSFVISLVVLLVFVAVVTLVSGLDEFFLDLVYLLRILPRRTAGASGEQALVGAKAMHTEESLAGLPEKPIAVMIPAWNEGDVIAQMLENTLQTVRYSNYQVFVGVYPNDEATNAAVEKVSQRYGRVHRAVCPLPGPTNKADCLNAIFERIFEFERDAGMQFDIFVQHDAEDLVHPQSMRVFNFYQPQTDMVQLPVFALETDWREFTGCHYVDEFCEHHIKSIPVRELLSGSVPSAGVGCGFSRAALEAMRERQATGDGGLFNQRSLTEDYDFALRLGLAGRTTRFIRPVLKRREMVERGWFKKKLVEVEREEIVATREYFPSEFQPAVRQKARWILGISIQGWQLLGWPGSFWTRYMLMRDRKTLLTSQINVLGYLVLAGFFFLFTVGLLFPDEYQYPSIVERGSWLWYVVLADTFFLLWRLVLRAHCVYVVYGWGPALWSVPRLIWGNLIGFFATNRAIWLFSRSRLFGKALGWEKTQHSFPTEQKISSFRRRLGDLLLEQRLIAPEELEAALAEQRAQPTQARQALGEILLNRGLVGERELFNAIGVQLLISPQDIDPYATPLEALRLLPREMALQYSVFPVAFVNGTRMLVATDQILTREVIEKLEAAVERHVELCLTTRTGLEFAIVHGYERLESPDQLLLGERLVAAGLLTPEQRDEALAEQRRAYVRLADVLTEMKLVTPGQLQEARREAKPGEMLSDTLVRLGRIGPQQLREALRSQTSRTRPLGEIAVSHGWITADQIRRVQSEAE